MKPAGRADAVEHYPARSMDVSMEPAAVHQIVGVAMARHRYRLCSDVSTGVGIYRTGSAAKEILNLVVPFEVFPFTAGRPHGSGEIAAWTEPAPGGVRLALSLREGFPHAVVVRAIAAELIEEFRANGVLIQASEPFTGLDLPPDSPGRPKNIPKRRRVQPS